MFANIALRVNTSYAVNPGVPYWMTLIRILQYLKGTRGMKLIISRVCDTPAPLLYGFSDADWASTDIDERSDTVCPRRALLFSS